MLEKILSSNKQKNKTGAISSSANNLVTAWAMQKIGKSSQAESFLKEWLKNDPDSVWSKWVSNTYHGKSMAITDNTKTDENYRVLKALERLIL